MKRCKLDVSPDGQGLAPCSELRFRLLARPAGHEALIPGAVQLSRDQVVKALKDAKGGAVSFEALPPEGPAPDAKAPSRKLTVRTARGSVTFASFDPERFSLRPSEPASPRSSFRPGSSHRPSHEPSTRATRTRRGLPWAASALRSRTGSSSPPAPTAAVSPWPRRRPRAQGLEAPKSIKVGEEERPIAPVIPLPAVKGLIEVLSVLEPNKKLALGFTAEGWFELQGERTLDVGQAP